jgi:hypothetical protein
MAPGQYTELIFLDEATALAAGHRPVRQLHKPHTVLCGIDLIALGSVTKS